MPSNRRSPSFLIAESESEEARRRRRAYSGRSNGETCRDLLQSLVPDATIELAQPIEDREESHPTLPLEGYDGIFLTGSPLHLYKSSPDVRRHVDFMRKVFESRTPSFGSCAGLQVAVVAAGGTVRENSRGHEVAFARRIKLTEAGRSHPFMNGRPDGYDALTLHSDEVEHLPDGATLLATNTITTVQAAEITCAGGTFWGVQYHPELPMSEIADSLCRQSDDIIKQGLAQDEREVADYAEAVRALAENPKRRDLAWRLGLDEQVIAVEQRQSEVRNFLQYLVQPTMSARSRG